MGGKTLAGFQYVSKDIYFLKIAFHCVLFRGMHELAIYASIGSSRLCTVNG